MNSLGIFTLIFLASFPVQAAKHLCGPVYVEEGKISLDANEKILVCGSGKSEQAWRTIPLPQIEYELRLILQNRGHNQPVFERRNEELRVWVGPVTKISKFTVKGGQDILKPAKKRHVVGQPLTPAKLNEITQWATQVLNTEGYACSTRKITAHSTTGEVLLTVNEGTERTIGAYERLGMENMDPRSMTRFEAFRHGDIYDVTATQISISRYMSAGVTQSAYFTANCVENQKIDLKLNASLGKPRILRFGVGASTEEWAFTDITLRNARLDDRASSFTLKLHASPIIQRFDGASELYLLPWSARTFLGPRVRVSHDIEVAYETLDAQTGIDIGRAWDSKYIRYQAQGGPTLNYLRTYRGIGPYEASFISWQAQGAITSHLYEANLGPQWEGWMLTFNYLGQRKGLASEVSADRYDFAAKQLWNVGNYFPPLFVLGIRLQASATTADQITIGKSRDQLPVGYRIFFGGDDTLRGFSRQSLNNGGLGFLTAIYLGTELRLIEELPWGLEPFLLWDAAKLGDRKMTVDRALFTSYGGGIRWRSPFGTLRGSIAKGLILNKSPLSSPYKEELVWFVSFGREF